MKLSEYLLATRFCHLCSLHYAMYIIIIIIYVSGWLHLYVHSYCYSSMIVIHFRIHVSLQQWQTVHHVAIAYSVKSSLVNIWYICSQWAIIVECSNTPNTYRYLPISLWHCDLLESYITNHSLVNLQYIN